MNTNFSDSPANTPPVERPGVVTRLVNKLLSAEHRELLGDVRATWMKLWLPWKILLVVLVLTTLGLALWVWLFRAGVREPAGVWSRLLDSGLITGLAGVVFAYLKKRLQQPAPVPDLASATHTPLIAEDDGSLFLGLSPNQWLGLLVALFIPTLLASLVSSFLVGDQVHLWLTGPLLAVLGIAITVLSWETGKAHPERHPSIDMMVGSSAVLLYALTCINTRWVLLFYTVGVILPALHLFTVVRRGVPPIRWNAPLLAGFGVVAVAMALGIFALPRSNTEARSNSDQSAKLVGTWMKDGKALIFTSGGTATVEGGYSAWVAKFKFDGKKLTIFNDQSDKVVYDLDLVSDNEMLLGKDSGGAFGEFSVMTGRWQRDGTVGGGRNKKMGGDEIPSLKSGDPKPGPKDLSSVNPPSLDSPLAAKLFGKWEIVEGEQKGTVTFTKGGTVLFVWWHTGLKQNWTDTGNFTLGGTKLKIKAAGEYGGESIREIEFLSDDELLIQKSTGVDFTWLYGRLRRAK